MMDESDKAKKSLKKAITILLVSVIVILGAFAGLVSGTLQYSFATIRCMRAPVTADNFLDRVYQVPGDSGYSPNIFSNYFCNKEQAISAGFHRTPLSDPSHEKSLQREEEVRRFSPEKVDFKVYVPAGDDYTLGKMEVYPLAVMNGNKQVFFSLEKDAHVAIRVREGKTPNSYELCKGAEDSCEIVGADALGHSIKKQIANTNVISYSVTINDTFINLENASALSTEEVTAIFNSLTKYSDK